MCKYKDFVNFLDLSFLFTTQCTISLYSGIMRFSLPLHGSCKLCLTTINQLLLHLSAYKLAETGNDVPEIKSLPLDFIFDKFQDGSGHLQFVTV